MLSERLRELLEPGVNALGYELLLLEYEPRKNRGLLRLYIDHENGVGLEDCESVSRQISAILDVEDPIVNEFTLEVSSPGIDRPLVTKEHFEKVVGQDVKVSSHGYYMGRRRFKGRLEAVDDENIVVEVDGESYDIPLNDIDKARLEPDWDSLAAGNKQKK